MHSCTDSNQIVEKMNQGWATGECEGVFQGDAKGSRDLS